MKKTLVALAVLGTFAGAASAQSSVTLYGRLDTAVSYIKKGNGDTITGMNGNAPIGGSRWGLRGSEDLGGGLKANFVLESGFNSDTGEGSSATKLFNRAAWVGISSASMGEVRLGRQQTLTRELNLFAADISGEGELTILESVTAAPRPLFQNLGNGSNTRIDNAVSYISPNFSGFQIRALVAAGEGASARQQGVSASYGAGPLKVGLAYEEFADAPGKVQGSYNQVFTAGVSYNFGVATVALGYQNTSDFGNITAGAKSGIDHDAYNVGVMVPFGGAYEFRAQYTSSKIKPPAGADIDQDKYGVSLRYALSKRTTVYGMFTQRGGDAKNTYAKETEAAVGIGHNF